MQTEHHGPFQMGSWSKPGSHPRHADRELQGYLHLIPSMIQEHGGQPRVAAADPALAAASALTENAGL